MQALPLFSHILVAQVILFLRAFRFHLTTRCASLLPPLLVRPPYPWRITIIKRLSTRRFCASISALSVRYKSGVFCFTLTTRTPQPRPALTRQPKPHRCLALHCIHICRLLVKTDTTHYETRTSIASLVLAISKVSRPIDLVDQSLPGSGCFFKTTFNQLEFLPHSQP